MDEYEKIRSLRHSRQSQCRKRSAEFSYATALENALIILAWEAGEISIGDVAHALKLGRADVMRERLQAIRKGMHLAFALNEPRRKRTIKQAERLREKLRALEEQAHD